jgi:hypothetical protein
LPIEPFGKPKKMGAKAKDSGGVMKTVDPTGTPKNQTILYLEGRKSWHRAVGEMLAEAGYQVLLPDDPVDAVQYHSAHEEEITVVLCGESYSCSDNNDWATELHDRGFKVIILACLGDKYVPFVGKGDNWHEKILPMLEQVIGGQQQCTN